MLVDSVDHAVNADSDEPLDTAFRCNWTRRIDRSFVPHGLPVPTNAIPGTLEKIAIIKGRLVDGVELYHPDDAKSIRCISTSRVYCRRTRCVVSRVTQ